MTLLHPLIATPKSKNQGSTEDGGKLDIEKLRLLCVTKHGLVNADIRKIVWPILLNAESFQNRET